MRNVCPQCGRTYHDAHRFCEDDGAVLRSLVSARAGRALRGIAVALLLVAVLLGVGRLLLPRYLVQSIDVTVEQARLVSSGAAVAHSGGGDPVSEIVGGIIDAVRAAVLGEAVEVRLRLRNRTILSCALRSADYTLFVGDQVIVQDVWSASGGSLAFRRGQSVRLSVVVHPKPGAVSATVIDAVRRGEVRVRATGQVRVNLPVVGDLSVPFRVERVHLGL